MEIPDLDAGVGRAGDDSVLGPDDLALLLLAPHPLVVVDLLLALEQERMLSLECLIYLVVQLYFTPEIELLIIDDIFRSKD